MNRTPLAFIGIVLLVAGFALTAACAPDIPGQRQGPPPDKPYNGEIPAERPHGVDPSWPGVRIFFYGHDSHDFDKRITFSFNMLAVAANPKLQGGFVEPDTGRSWPFREPSTGTNLLVTPGPKATPYGFTVWYPPGESIAFTIAYSFEGEWGDTVGCEFQDALGVPYTQTRTYAAVLDPAAKQITGALAHASGQCLYTT